MIFNERGKEFAIPALIILLGASILAINIILYPHFLPQTITSENSHRIQQQVYGFYTVLIGGEIMILCGVSKLYSYNKIKSEMGSNNVADSSFLQSDSTHHVVSELSLISIIANIADNRNYIFKVFVPVTLGYGIFYSIVSSILIVRPEGLHHTMGMAAPSALIMTHGPAGYAPTIALAITDHIGLLVIPINLVILCIVSALVGLNAVLLVYAFQNRPRKNNAVYVGEGRHHLDGSPFMAGLGASAAIFAVCPTCASLYIFGILTGSFASTITSFGVAFYGLFAAVSIPLLLISPVVTAYSIRKTLGLSICSFKKEN